MNKKRPFDFKEFIFTGFYSGYSPLAPGTAGTIVGLIIYFLEYLIFGQISWLINLTIVLITLYPAIKLGDKSEIFFNRKDPPEVVLDEVLGYWISVLFFPFSWSVAITAFFVFRIMDILKPFPANRFQDLQGGLGIMLDDYIAGLYTFLIILGLKLINFL